MGVGSLCEPESLGKLLLGEACLVSERVETLAERSALACGLPAGFTSNDKLHRAAFNHP